MLFSCNLASYFKNLERSALASIESEWHMAEAAVSGIIIKLGDLLFGEVVFLYDVSNQMELVKLQLHQMQCFLKDAVSKQKKDERVKGWVRDIRDVAYETEDAIDEYLWVVARSRLKHVGFFEKCFRKPFEIYARHKLGKSICKIQIRLNIISQGRTIFGIKNLDDERSDRRPMLRGPWVPDDDEYEIVGFKNNQRSIISQLIAGKRTPRRQIISIVGQGGLGKTTLAHKVYNSKEVKGYFDERIWLTVSIEFNLNVLLKKVLDKLGKPIHKETENDDEYLLVEVKLSLRQKRYLIVFDDVWTFESIDQFQKALPNDSNGSRVLMTSRFSNIAKRADLGSITHELQFLNEEESLQLLLAKAFFPSTSNISDDLIELAKKLAKKCGGLPLALVLIGGLLSMRAPNYNDWYRVLQTMDWKSNCIECMKVLGTSYEDLPHSLKPCFLYFGCFPEDTDIGASALMRMWIAEGFIQSDGRGTLEDTAECYLEELIQRCMVQVSMRSRSDGTIRHCHVHDLLRELAISEAKEENFLNVYPQQNEGQHSLSRREAYFQGNVFECSITKPKLRSLLFFDVCVRNLATFRLLRVLELCHVKTIKDFPVEVTTMVFLRYLGLRCCSVTTLPKTIDRLQDLQTLDTRLSALTSVPDTLWNIKTLRHVLASYHKPINGPPKGAKLVHLQTLRQVKLMAWGEALPCLRNIRKLGLSNKDNRELEPTIQLLKHLEHLCSLCIEWQTLPEHILDMRSFLSYNRIQSLRFEGHWPQYVTLNAAMLPVNITKLHLFDTRFKHDPILELRKLQHLKVLYLGHNSIACNKIVFLTGGFSQLQWLFLVNIDLLEECYVEKGSLPVIKHLTIQQCSKLRMLPDLQYVILLHELVLTSMPEEFIFRTAQPDGKDCHKIKHIPSITVRPLVRSHT